MKKLPHITTAILLTVTVSLRPAAPVPPPKELDQLWADLGTKDPVKADRTMARLLAHPAHAVPLVANRLRPVSNPDPRRLAAWLAALDDDAFAVRQEATHELAKLGEAIEPALNETLRHPASLEVRRRVEGLLEKLRRERLYPSAERVRAARAIEVLERIGDRAAWRRWRAGRRRPS